jgi:hypothetical protein
MKGNIPKNVLDEINKRPTLVNELLQYGADVSSGNKQPISLDFSNGNLLQFTGDNIQFGYNWSTWTPEQFVGNLSHEIGHYANLATDTAYLKSLNINQNDPNASALYEIAGLRAEGEAVVNNYLVQQEIIKNGGSAIVINGDSAANGKIDQAIGNLQATDAAKGLTDAQQRTDMVELGGSLFSGLHPSGTPAGTTYADMYAAHGGEIFSAMGIMPGQILPGAISEVDFFDPTLSGNLTSATEKLSSGQTATQYFSNSIINSSVTSDQFGNVLTQTIYSHNADGSYTATIYDAHGAPTGQDQFHKDGSENIVQFNRDGSQTATVFDSHGNESEYTTFGANGKITQDVLYDTMTGRETQETDWSADGSSIAHLFNGDGTQNAIVYNASGYETEYATFGSNGKITQDVVYDPTTGRETQETDWSADGSSIAHLFNGDGTQNAIVYNASGRETEDATFGKNGAKTQDIFYDATTGHATEQDDYNADGSGVAHIFHADGTQDAAMFDPSGHISEYATFAANGALTTDAFFDATGRETQLNEYQANQTIVHLLNADNSQTATVYNANGHETEFAKFSASGQKTDDYFFDGTTGRETEYDQYGSNGSMTAHLFNADNSQNAIIFNGNGQEIEYDSFDSGGKLTGFTQFTYGAGGGYDAVAYGPTGYELGWSDYSSNNMLLSSGGNQYDFTLDDSYDSGSDYFDFDGFDDIGSSNEYGFYI